jgi:hypothetical protein
LHNSNSLKFALQLYRVLTRIAHSPSSNTSVLLLDKVRYMSNPMQPLNCATSMAATREVKTRTLVCGPSPA